MEFQTFDAEYVQRLASGDPCTESHFSMYWQKFLSLKLRSRGISADVADDVRQETLCRVLKTLRQGPGIARPESFGAFVNSVCNNVLLELHHRAVRDGADEPVPEVHDGRMSIDQSLIHAERRRMVRVNHPDDRRRARGIRTLDRAQPPAPIAHEFATESANTG